MKTVNELAALIRGARDAGARMSPPRDVYEARVDPHAYAEMKREMEEQLRVYEGPHAAVHCQGCRCLARDVKIMGVKVVSREDHLPGVVSVITTQRL